MQSCTLNAEIEQVCSDVKVGRVRHSSWRTRYYVITLFFPSLYTVITVSTNKFLSYLCMRVAQPKHTHSAPSPEQHRGQTLPLLEHVEERRQPTTQQLKETTYGWLLKADGKPFRASFIISFHLLFSHSIVPIGLFLLSLWVQSALIYTQSHVIQV